MKRILIAAITLACASFAADAQYYYQDSKNPEMLRHAERHEPCRKEIVLPAQVNGFNVYKADLHSHTIYSDGQVIPAFRVQEAWQDGLDIIAITDHLETRKHEGQLYEYLKKYADTEFLANTAGVKAGMIDLNYPVQQALPEAAKLGLLVVPGTEISRSGATVGHFNALFTKDNNTIYDEDALQSMRNARSQGALVQHNHPGWRRENLQMTEVEKAAYEEGLIDGVEVMNGKEFYPGIIDRVLERGLYMSSNSDIHFATANEYRLTGTMRNMTIVFAEEMTLDSVKDALVNNRSIAYGYGTLCGSEELLKAFFLASVRLTHVPGQEAACRLTNLTSIPYILQRGNGNYFRLDPFSSISISLSKNSTAIPLTVVNAWTSKDMRLKVSIKPEN